MMPAFEPQPLLIHDALSTNTEIVRRRTTGEDCVRACHIELKGSFFYFLPESYYFVRQSQCRLYSIYMVV